MKLFHKEVKKYITESEMGDGKTSIRVKFVTSYFFMSKCIFKTEDIDMINFHNLQLAKDYAKHALKQSFKSCLRVFGTYSEINSACAYCITTDYNNAVYKAAYSLSKFGIHKQYTVLYVTFNNKPPQFIIAERKSEYGGYSGNYLYSYFTLADSDNTAFASNTLDGCYLAFSSMVNGRITYEMERERRERLSKTLVRYNEIPADENHDKLIPIDICPLDDSRNDIIREELKRTSEYTNFLKTLIK